MITYRTLENCTPDVNSVITVGTFDGVHRGHQRILSRMKEIAQSKNGRTVVITFDPHPQIVLNKVGREPIRLLSSMPERLKLLESHDVDVCVIIPFTFEFSQTDAASFIRDHIHKRIGISDFLVGYDHTFGKDRSGNDTLIAELGTELGYSSEVVPPLMIDDKKISSTQIRRALQSGELDSANYMLGYEYSLDGIVVEGDGRGRHLGYPTANVESMDMHKLLPRYGVYLVSSVIDGQLVFGMANIGTRPTFTEDTHPRLEVHYFDLNQYLYDRKLTVTFHAFIRPEMKFESVDMFWSQLRDDRDKCEEIIASRYS